eukprot:10395797-Karenia_brevis.AAC.1
MALAEKYSGLLHDFNTFLAASGVQPWVGIDAAGAENRYKVLAAQGKQHRLHGAKYGAAPLLPRDLGKQSHVGHALSLKHPYDNDAILPIDLEFAVQRICASKDGLQSWRSQQLHLFQQLANDCHVLDQKCWEICDPDVLRTSHCIHCLLYTSPSPRDTERS